MAKNDTRSGKATRGCICFWSGCLFWTPEHGNVKCGRVMKNHQRICFATSAAPRVVLFSERDRHSFKISPRSNGVRLERLGHLSSKPARSPFRDPSKFTGHDSLQLCQILGDPIFVSCKALFLTGPNKGDVQRLKDVSLANKLNRLMDL